MWIFTGKGSDYLALEDCATMLIWSRNMRNLRAFFPYTGYAVRLFKPRDRMKESSVNG